MKTLVSLLPGDLVLSAAVGYGMEKLMPAKEHPYLQFAASSVGAGICSLLCKGREERLPAALYRSTLCTIGTFAGQTLAYVHREQDE